MKIDCEDVAKDILEVYQHPWKDKSSSVLEDATERLERFKKVVEAHERKRIRDLLEALLKAAQEDAAISQFRYDVYLENQVIGIQKCLEAVKMRPKTT